MKNVILLGALVLWGVAVSAQAPNWKVDAARFQFQSTITAVVTVDLAAESDAQNRLAAFKGSEVRGVAAPIVISGKAYYFLQLYANSFSDTLALKLYDASSNSVLTARVPWYFKDAELKGSIEKPVAISFIYQFNTPPKWENKLADVQIETGESIASVDLKARVKDEENNPVSFGVSGNLGISVQISTAGVASFSYPPGFTGTEQVVFTAYETASVSSLARDTMQIKVLPVDLAPVANEGDAFTAFSGEAFPPLHLPDYFTSPDGQLLQFAVEPAASLSPVPRPNWQVNSADFQQTMNVTAVVTVYDQPSQGNNLLGAFVGNEVRGVASPKTVAGKTVYFLTVYANANGETVSFKLWHEASGTLLNSVNTIAYNPQRPGGSIDAPFQTRFGGVTISLSGSVAETRIRPGFSGKEQVLIRAIEAATVKKLSAPSTFAFVQKAFERPNFRSFKGEEVFDNSVFRQVDLDTLISPQVENELDFSVERKLGTALNAVLESGNLLLVQPETPKSYGAATFLIVAFLRETGIPVDSIEVNYERKASLRPEPSTQTSGVSISNIQHNRLQLSWMRGNGDSVLVLASRAPIVETGIADTRTYRFDPEFGAGELTGDDVWVVYKGTETSAEITGLKSSLTYHFAVLEFNAGNAGSNNYRTGDPSTIDAETGLLPAPSVVFNKLIRTDETQLELMVIQDELDLRGMQLQVYSPNDVATRISSIRFSESSVWSAISAGTLISLSGGNVETDSSDLDLVVRASLADANLFDERPETFLIPESGIALLRSAESSLGYQGLLHAVAWNIAPQVALRLPEPSLVAETILENNAGFLAHNATSGFADFNGSGTQKTEANAIITGVPHSASNEIFRNSIKSRHHATVTGPEGWRMMTSPVSASFASLFESVWTQGISGADSETGAPNILQFDGTTYRAPASLNTSIVPGSGFIVNMYADDNYNEPGMQGGFPKNLPLRGLEHAAPVQFTPNAGTGVYTLAGNPFASTLDWDLVTKTNVSYTAYVYDPVYEATETGDTPVSVGGAYRAWNGSVGGLTNGLIAPFQGFWVQALNDSPSLTFENGAKSTGAAFRGKTQSQPLSIRLVATHERGSSESWIEFSERGETGFDAWDGWKFHPFSERFISLTSGSLNGYGLEINHLPIPEEAIEIPFDLTTTENGQFSLKLETTLDEKTVFEVLDVQTGLRSTLKPGELFAFEVLDSAKRIANEAPVLTRTTAADQPRFVLIVKPGVNTASDSRAVPNRFALEQNYPNPFNPATTVRFSLPQASEIDVSVFDMNGRCLATLVKGYKPAGAHSVSWNAEQASSGVYLLQMKAGGTVFNRKMTLLK